MKSNWKLDRISEGLKRNKSTVIAMALGLALGFAGGQTVHSMNEPKAAKVPVNKIEKSIEKAVKAPETASSQSNYFSLSTDPWTGSFFNDSFFNEIGSLDNMPVAVSPWLSGSYLNGPKLETFQSAEEIKIRAEVPGIESEDLDVTVTDNSLTIKGERKSESGASKQTVSGRIERSITLPCRVERDRAQARLKNGVLSITIPKARIAQKEANKLTIKND